MSFFFLMLWHVVGCRLSGRSVVFQVACFFVCSFGHCGRKHDTEGGSELRHLQLQVRSLVRVGG